MLGPRPQRRVADAAGKVDWDQIFGTHGARRFHCGGIFAGLLETTGEAMHAARDHGTIVSYDLNYRPSLWRSRGGPARAAEVNERLVDLVDMLLGNEEDFSAGLGYELDGIDAELLDLDRETDAPLLERCWRNPQFSVVASTLGQARTATSNDWARSAGRAPASITPRRCRGSSFDRVGGGDSFASGFFYGLMSGADVDRALAYGVAHGALAMTTPGDTSMATLAEVNRLVSGAAARVQR